jgi:hypothetical protein
MNAGTAVYVVSSAQPALLTLYFHPCGSLDRSKQREIKRNEFRRLDRGFKATSPKVEDSPLWEFH